MIKEIKLFEKQRFHNILFKKKRNPDFFLKLPRPRKNPNNYPSDKVLKENNNNYEIREGIKWSISGVGPAHVRQSYEPRTSVSINVTNGDADDRCQPTPLLSIRYTIYFFHPRNMTAI